MLAAARATASKTVSTTTVLSSSKSVLQNAPRMMASGQQIRTATSLGISTARPPSGFPNTRYGGVYSVTLIPGDGVGKEITHSVEEVFNALNVPVEFEKFDVSGENDPSDSEFQKAMASLKRNKVGLKGILYTPYEKSGHTSWNVAMRQQLDIFASVTLCKSLPGFPTRHPNVDIAIIRENTEGEYSGLEHMAVPGVVESLKIMTRPKCERIARFAFDFCLKNGRKKLTCVHKANIMKLGDGLFLRTFEAVAKEYEAAGIKTDTMIVDNTSMQLVAKPQQFDVMVMPNLYGSIISNIGAGLVGGPGLVPGASIGREFALFEPGCRHVARDIQGRDVANPAAMLLSATMLLRHLGLDHYANQIATSVYKVVNDTKVRTPDMGGKSHTTEFTKAVIEGL